MYQLKSSDSNNAKTIELLDNSAKLRSSIVDNWSEEVIRYELFQQELTDTDYRLLICAITCGDELKFPVLEKFARLYYFIAVNNYSNESLKITNFAQANKLYEQCGGDYKELDIENDTSEGRSKTARLMKFKAQHTLLWPEKNITWEIPVSFYRDKKTKTTTAMIAGKWAKYCYVNIDEQRYKLPRSIFMKFFAESLSQGKVEAESTNELRLLLDETNNSLVREVLEYIGYQYFKSITVDDAVSYSWSAEEDSVVAHALSKRAELFNDETAAEWVELGNNNYRLFNKGAKYVATRPVSGRLWLFKQ